MPKFLKEKELFFEELKLRYKVIKPEFQRKINRYDKIWDKAEMIAERVYNEVKTNKTLSQITREFVEEFYSYQGSILKSFRNLKTRTFEENFERAKELRIKERLKTFLKDFGEETFEFEYEYNGKIIKEDLELNFWIKRYLDHKISKNQLFDIIKEFKETNKDYLIEFYASSESSGAIQSEQERGNIY